MGDEHADDVAEAVEENRMADFGAVAVAGQEVVAVLGSTAQGIAADHDGHDPEGHEVQDASDEDGFQDTLATWSHLGLSAVWRVAVSQTL